MNLLPWREQTNQRHNLFLLATGVIGLSILTGIFCTAFLRVKNANENAKQKIASNYALIKRNTSNNKLNDSVKQRSWLATLNKNKELNHRLIKQLNLFAQVTPRDIHLNTITLQAKHLSVSGQSANSKAIYQLIENLKQALSQFSITLANLRQKQSQFYFQLLIEKNKHE